MKSIFTIFLYFLTFNVFAQSPSAEAFDKALNKTEFNSLSNFLLKNNNSEKISDYHFNASKDMETILTSIENNEKLIETEDISDIYVFSSTSTASYGSFDISNDLLWGRLYFRFDIQKNKITDLLIAPWGRDNFSKALFIFGDEINIKEYKRPNLSFIQLVFGGSPIEMLFLLIAFITFILVLKNTLFKKSIYFGSILSQFQVILSCIAIYGITGVISLFGSMGASGNNRIAGVYINSLTEFLIKIFAISLCLFVLMLIKLKPIKLVKPWMYSNLLVIPGLTIGFLVFLQKILFAS